MDDLVFHSVMPLAQARVSGSTIRPQKMLQAFRDLGVGVRVCAGSSAERAATWRDIMSSGRDYLGVYSELSTVPIALTDPDHLPRALAMDSRAFQRARAKGWPVSAYYRDVHWRFSEYRVETSLWKRAAAYAFYQLELWQLRRSIDHLFLPSIEMLDYIPGGFPREHVSALPPGGTCLDNPGDQLRRPGTLRLLYVGGVMPPLYDLSDILAAVAQQDGVSLTVCCRADEWRKWRSSYRPARGLKIVHANGAALADLYRNADICAIAPRRTEYWSFAMPVKLFEAIGAGLPVIASAHTAVGRFVRDEKIGWTVETCDEFSALLAHLRQDVSQLSAVRERVKLVRERHTWNARATRALNVLEAYRPASRQ